MTETMAFDTVNANETVEANADTSYRKKGAENRAAFMKKIQEGKSLLSGWMNKAKSYVAEKIDSSVDHAFATPEMAADGAKAVGAKLAAWDEKAHEKMYQVADSVITGADNVGEAITSRWNGMLEFGQRSIAKAEAARRALVDRARERYNEARLAQINTKEEEYREKLALLAQQKMALQKNIFNQAEMAVVA